MEPEVNQKPTPTQPTPAVATELKAIDTKTDGATSSSWQRVTNRSRRYGRVAALLGVILVAGGTGGYFISLGLKPTTQSNKNTSPVVQTLSDAEIQKLGQVSNNLGTSNQILTIGANSVFTGKVNVASDLTLGGHFNANGPVAFTALSVSGAATVTSLAVAQGLQVSGLTNAQNGLTVHGQGSFDTNLAVSGTVNAGSVSTTTLSTKNLQLSGPLSLGHLISTGSPVTVAGGSALGSGGSASVSGNDTAGTVTAGFGSGGASGIIATVTFKSAYGANVHVLLTPLNQAAASSQYFVSRTATGFSISVSGVTTGSLSFDYVVVQ